jgi:hypothetical protein
MHTPDYLIVKISGVVDGKNIIPMADDFFSALSNSEHYKVLIDSREQEVKTTVLEDHQQAEYLGSQLIGIKHRIALLVPPHRLHLDKFFETVSVNRGVKMCIFTKEEDAINYLMEEIY